MTWNNPSHTPPPSGISILVKMLDGSVHEGHYIKNASKYVKNVNRFRIYKLGNKTHGTEEISGWAAMPK